MGVSLKREPLLPAVNEVEQRGGVYRPRHNGVIVTSGRGVVGGMAVGGRGLVRDHNAGECQRGGGRINRDGTRAVAQVHFIELY